MSTLIFVFMAKYSTFKQKLTHIVIVLLSLQQRRIKSTLTREPSTRCYPIDVARVEGSAIGNAATAKILGILLDASLRIEIKSNIQSS